LRTAGAGAAPVDTTTFFSETRLDAICMISPTYLTVSFYFSE
jgi:hypothetical protein